MMWMMNGASVVLCSALLLFAIIRPSSSIPYFAVITFACIYAAYLFLTGGNNNLGYFWVILLPMAAVFLLGWKAGTFYSIACLLICLAGIFNSEAYPGVLNVAEASLIWRIFTAYGFSFAIAVLYDFNVNSVTNKLVQANSRLQDSNEHIRSIFRSAPAGIGLVVDRVIKQVNSRLCTITGYDEDELVNKNARILYPGDAEFEYVGREQSDQLKDHWKGSIESRWLRKDGTLIDVLLNATPRDIEDMSKGVTFTVLDITDSKRAEKERENLQAQLFQAQKMESVGTLAGGVAHDFNNLLQAMRGNIEMLLQSKSADHPDARRLQTVTKSMDRAASLVRQLLFFSRKIEFNKVRVDVNREVRDVVQILNRTIPKMITLELHLESAVWIVSGDPVQVEQVLLNLASNAVDAMPGGGRLVIETGNVVLDEDFVKKHPGSIAGSFVLLSVTDTGYGMDKEVLGHAFDPFFTTKEVDKGTGLGLASAYGIVKAHGGYIQCYSEPGEGTTIKIYWPAVQDNEGMTKESSQETSPEGGSETILVVDDDPQIHELTAEALEMLGYRVRLAGSGEQALEIYQEHQSAIDLVLLDLNMPGMGGHRCLKELLRINPAAKVVIASGYSAHGQGKAALSSGAKDFIGKPYQLKELAAMVRKVLNIDV